MWREDNHSLRERSRCDWSCAVVCIRLSAWPTRNGVLEVVEDFYVDLVERTLLLEKFSENICEIVFLSKFEDRLLNLLAEPYYCLAYELRSPLAWTDKPRRHISCKKAC